MSPTTQKFGWKDRDTAARDLLQLVYHAPEPISRRAIELMQAIRSPAVVPELLDIFRDETRPRWERIYSLRAVAYTPGHVYLPELKAYLPIHGDDVSQFSAIIREDTLLFVSRHPSNHDWFDAYEKELFGYLDSLPPAAQIERLSKFSFLHREGKVFLFALLDRVMHLVETHPALLDLEIVLWLYHDDDRPSTLEWLAERWQTLIYLCLTADLKSIPELLDAENLVTLLEAWEELRVIVFASCPSLIPEYEATKGLVGKHRSPRFSSIDLNQSALWREMAGYYDQAKAGNNEGWSHLHNRIHARDILERMTAIHFLGKLAPPFPNFMRHLLLRGNYSWEWQDHWIWQDPTDPDFTVTHAPVRFEAGDVLRQYIFPEVWETLINAYFTKGGYERFFLDWIAYQTDRLSGLDVEYTGATLAVEDRPWFRALVEREQQTE